jgi:hypothetical protein
MLSSSYKTKHFLFQTVKLLLVFVAIAFLYKQLVQANGFFKFSYQTFPLGILITAFLFSCLNWAVEFLKWKCLMAKVRPISTYQAIRQSLIAFSLTVFTPNKLGEYGIRPLFFENKLRKRVALLTGIHHFSQLLATLLFGVCGFSFLLLKYPNFQTYSYPVVSILLMIGILGLIIWIIHKKGWISVAYFHKSLNFMNSLKKGTRAQSFGFSILRYVIFSHQFCFLLAFFNLPISYFEMIAAITTIYFLSTFLPAISLFDIVIKGSIGVIVFGLLQVEEVIIIQVMGLMWGFNYAIPLIIGSVLALQLRYSVNEKIWKLL